MIRVGDWVEVFGTKAGLVTDVVTCQNGTAYCVTTADGSAVYSGDDLLVIDGNVYATKFAKFASVVDALKAGWEIR